MHLNIGRQIINIVLTKNALLFIFGKAIPWGGGGTSIYLGYGDVPPFRVTFCSKLCSLRVCFSSYPKLCSLRVYIFLYFSTPGRYFVFFISSKVLNFSPTLNLISTIVSTTYPYLSSSILCTPLNVALNIEPPASDQLPVKHVVLREKEPP